MMIRLVQQEVRLWACLMAAASLLACGGSKPLHRAEAGAPPTQRARVSPAPPTELYAVHPGESLRAIARCSGVSVEDLARSNGIPDPDLIYAGERLQLPAGHRCGRGADPGELARAGANALLVSARTRLDAADFEGAIALAAKCEQKLAARAQDAKANAIRARCLVVAGTAEIGLDEPERAVKNFRRAFELDPKIEAATDATSPRVRELMTVARGSSTP